MTPEDAEVMRMVRRELSKRSMDTGQMDIQVKAGKVTLAGRVLHYRDERGVDLRSEINIVIKNLMADRLVKAVFDQVHCVVDQDAGEKEHNARGRMRSGSG